MGAPVFANRSVCFVAKWGTDDAGYNPVGAPMARLTIAAALADLAANYPTATAAAPHVVAIEPGIYITPAFALPPFTFITLSHDGPLNPTQGVIILLTGNLTLAAGWAVNQTAFGGFANVTIRPNVSQDIDLTMPAPAAGSPARTVILRDVVTSCSLAWQATGAGDAIEFNNFSQDGAAADTVTLAGGNIKIRNMESAAVVTMIDTASRVAAVQCYGLQITDPAAGLVCSSVGAGFVARLGNCDLRDLTLNETAPGVITVYADAPSIPLAASLHFTGTAASGDLIKTTDGGAIAGGAGGDVVGPAGATATAIAVYDGTTGKLIANSGLLLTGTTITTAANADLTLAPNGTGNVALTATTGCVYMTGSGSAPNGVEVLEVKIVGSVVQINAINRGLYNMPLQLQAAGGDVEIPSGSLTTGAPSGGAAAAWKLGDYTAAAAVATGKIRIEVGGAKYDIPAQLIP